MKKENTNITAIELWREEGKMIPKGYITTEDFSELTKAEAEAFVIFELKEMVRHLEDVKKIVKDIAEVRRIHNL